MIGVNIALDDRSVKQLAYISGWESHWTEHMHNDLEVALAEAAETYFKPMIRSKRGSGTGESEASVRHEFTSFGDGVEIAFFGSLGALYMDEGNFPSGAVLDASEFGLKAFPVGKREGGEVTPRKTIHGMGHRTQGVPTHYAEKTVEWLANDKASELALQSIEKWFDSVVIGA